MAIYILKWNDEITELQFDILIKLLMKCVFNNEYVYPKNFISLDFGIKKNY